MYKFLLSNGCSFLTKRAGVNNHTGVLLAEKLGLDHVGLAQAGKGNDRLILTTKLFFYENPERIKENYNYKVYFEIERTSSMDDQVDI